MSTGEKLTPIRIGVRFTVEEFPHLPAVEIVGQTRNNWKVTEIAADGTLSSMTYRLRKAGLIGKTVRILPPGPLPPELVAVQSSAIAPTRASR